MDVTLDLHTVLQSLPPQKRYYIRMALAPNSEVTPSIWSIYSLIIDCYPQETSRDITIYPEFFSYYPNALFLGVSASYKKLLSIFKPQEGVCTFSKSSRFTVKFKDLYDLQSQNKTIEHDRLERGFPYSFQAYRFYDRNQGPYSLPTEALFSHIAPYYPNWFIGLAVEFYRYNLSTSVNSQYSPTILIRDILYAPAFKDIKVTHDKLTISLFPYSGKAQIYITSPDVKIISPLRGTESHEIDLPNGIVYPTYCCLANALGILDQIHISSSPFQDSRLAILPENKVIEDIHTMIDAGESINVEFKEKPSEDKWKWLKTVVAFSNTQGGTILFGITDDGDAKGFNQQEVKSMKDAIANSISDTIDPSPIATISTIQIEESKHVIIVVVEKCPFPIYLRKDGAFSYYKRFGATSRSVKYDVTLSPSQPRLPSYFSQ